MKVYLASDHGGFFYKEEIQKHLEGKGYDVVDCGNEEYDKDDDYTDFVFPLAKKVVKDKGSFGVILGRSGNGELIAANKVKGIRAAMGCSPKMAEIARKHNDANVLSLGADHINLQQALSAVDVFLRTEFLGKERYQRRIKATDKYENSKS
jgi:ribose 5-phosphate isomerase B